MVSESLDILHCKVTLANFCCVTFLNFSTPVQQQKIDAKSIKMQKAVHRPCGESSKIREVVRIKMDHRNMELEDIMTKRENNVDGHKETGTRKTGCLF
jgi:hypothetical protein